jgi:serine/threonine-protein kinase RsbW
MMVSEPAQRMSVPTIDAVARCTEFAVGQAQEAGFSRARVHEIELVVEEVVANICHYSYGDQLGSVELCCRRADGPKMVLEFVDYGRPCDVLALPAPDLSLDLDQRGVGGLGVSMLRALVDQATYRRDDARNVLSVTVHAAPKLGGNTTAS